MRQFRRFLLAHTQKRGEGEKEPLLLLSPSLAAGEKKVLFRLIVLPASGGMGLLGLTAHFGVHVTSKPACIQEGRGEILFR